jgi:hypothetical protein
MPDAMIIAPWQGPTEIPGQPDIDLGWQVRSGQDPLCSKCRLCPRIAALMIERRSASFAILLRTYLHDRLEKNLRLETCTGIYLTLLR